MCSRSFPIRTGRTPRDRRQARARPFVPRPAFAARPHDHPRRAPSPDPLRVRPGGEPVAARDSPAPGAPLPDADPQLLAARRAGEALRQLAAGRVRQLHRALRLPREGARARHRRRPRRRHDGDQPVRLLRRALGRAFSVRLPAAARRGARARTARRSRPGRCSPTGSGISAGASIRAATRSTSSSRSTSACSREIRYLVRMAPGIQTPDETLQRGEGSCRDSGWLLVQILRHLGLAARFVSGYLVQLVADAKPLDGPAGPSADFTDLHAWAEVYVPGAGWVGLDPTSGLLAGEGHIPLAATAFPSSAAPVTGFTDVCESQLEFEMKVTRIHEDPRVTKPYSDAQWEEIDALGRAVDRELEAGSVRLTQGGEPTFVSIDDMDGPEWNFTALSPKKWTLGRTARVAPEGALRAGGTPRLRPGEVVSGRAGAALGARPALAARRPAALAERRPRRRCRVARGRAAEDAGRFASALARELGLDEAFVIPAYEDPLPLLQLEGNLPVNVDAATVPLKDYDDRARLRRMLEAGARQARSVCPAAAGARPRARAATRGGAGQPRNLDLALAELPVAAPARAALSPSRRFAGGIPPAARLAPGAPPGGDRARVRARPVRRPGDLHDAHVRSEKKKHDRPKRLPTPREVVRTAACVEARGGDAVRLPAAGGARRGLDQPRRRGGARRRGARARGAHRGLPAAARSAPPRARRDAGSGRDRGQRSSGVELGRARRQHDRALRGGAARPARHREVHARRAPHRHRRRQPHDARRPDAGGQRVPAPSGRAEEPRHLLAEPSLALVPLLGAVHRADEPGAAGRRGPRRPAVRARDRIPADGRAGPAGRRGRLPVARRPAAAAPARRPDRQHPPRRVLDRQAVLAGGPARAASAWSSCGRSRCRRTRAWRWCRRSSCARSWPASGRSPTAAASSTGAPSSTTAGCCRTSCARTSTTW